MQKLIDKNSECPNVSFGAIYVMNESLRRHVDWRADVDVLEFIPKSIKKYWVNFAKPKSAILACPPCMKTLATFRSLWITFFSAR